MADTDPFEGIASPQNNYTEAATATGDDNPLDDLRHLLERLADDRSGYQWGKVGPVQQRSYVLPFTQQMLDDAEFFSIGAMLRRRCAYRRRFDALGPMAQAVVVGVQLVEEQRRKVVYEAERCPHCGCHPDEHADR
jgi:hypothetical protein